MEKSRKTKEIHAEQMLKVSTSLYTAFCVSILIVPISAVVGAAFDNVPANPLEVIIRLFGSWYGVVFLVTELLLYYVIQQARNNAFKIYNELYPDEDEA